MNMPITVRLATKADIKQSLSSRCTADFEPAYDRCGSCVTSADVSIGGAQLYER
jgi:hypothetical protein